MSVPSVTIAKDRLRNLLITDRIQCTPDMIEFLTSDLYQTISKYIEISPEQFDVKITRTDIHIKYTPRNDRSGKRLSQWRHSRHDQGRN